MNALQQQLIASLHQSPHRCVLALAGGGTSALAMLLNVPGGSRTVLEAIVPYHETAFGEFLGRHPTQFCSAETSRLMARRACERARWLAPCEAVVGLGCTATLATDRPKRGDHRFFIAITSDDGEATFALTLEKDARDRAGEEAILDAVLLNALAEAFGVAERLDVPFRARELLEVERQPRVDLLACILQGQYPALCAEPDGLLRRGAASPAVLLPGAFNPLHHAHWELAALAARRTGLPVAFELSVTNVDKPPLTLADVRRRLAQFQWRGRVWITRAPTFREKAELFPGTVFAVGADTAARIVQARYYQDCEDAMHAALEGIRRQGCRFLVAGREDAAGRFVAGGALAIPASFQDMFEQVPEREFRVAVSSTALREQVRPPVARPPDSP